MEAYKVPNGYREMQMKILDSLTYILLQNFALETADCESKKVPIQSKRYGENGLKSLQI
ncbi:unnamed protein product [Sphenostylis stenocarpa]|uniref:Uncharacterized protein n=1 Tax=Sphenostylis stenocarpa TaxID=92480 RepID=A0AA86SQY5_9FABA|nr:unnamed protein product [Sphenostylis stenocarpa]